VAVCKSRMAASSFSMGVDVGDIGTVMGQSGPNHQSVTGMFRDLVFLRFEGFVLFITHV